MKKNVDFLTLYLGLVIGALIMNLAFEFLDSTYGDGQIDAINGIIKYELVKQPDNTTSWRYIKEK